jgi:hypothetical protein
VADVNVVFAEPTRSEAALGQPRAIRLPRLRSRERAVLDLVSFDAGEGLGDSGIRTEHGEHFEEAAER